MSRKPQAAHQELSEVMQRARADGDDNVLYSVVKYCIGNKLEVPEWAQKGAEMVALARLMNPTPRTGRHVSREVRAHDHMCDIERWEAVEEIRAHKPGRRMSLEDVFYEAAAELAQRFSKDKHGSDAVRRSYFRVKKDPVWYLLVQLALTRVSSEQLEREAAQSKCEAAQLKRVVAALKRKAAKEQSNKPRL